MGFIVEIFQAVCTYGIPIVVRERLPACVGGFFTSMCMCHVLGLAYVVGTQCMHGVKDRWSENAALDEHVNMVEAVFVHVHCSTSKKCVTSANPLLHGSMHSA